MTKNWESYAWLVEDRYHLRGNLRQILSAIRRGLLEGPACEAQRAALGSVLDVLVRDPTTPVRAVCTIEQICEEMEARNRAREGAG